MVRTIGRVVLAPLALGLLLARCGESGSSDGEGGGAGALMGGTAGNAGALQGGRGNGANGGSGGANASGGTNGEAGVGDPGGLGGESGTDTGGSGGSSGAGSGGMAGTPGGSGGSSGGAGRGGVAGTPGVCQPGAYVCNLGNVHRCGSDGTTTTLVDTCLITEFCPPGAATCQTDVCTVGMSTCVGDLVSTCKNDGSGPEDAGMPCVPGNVCDTDQCRPVICQPNVTDCFEGDVQHCNAKGTARTIETDCLTTSYCDAAMTPTCLEDICSPGNAACDGETTATCGADGGSYVSPLTNCAASNQSCSLSGCVASVVEVLGSAFATSTSANRMMGHRYYVANARRLTLIESHIAFTGTIELTWFVYENTDTVTGMFTKVFETTTMSTSSGLAGFQSSGAIDFPLAARRYYIIGVRPLASVTSSYVTVSSGGKQFLSFGFTQGVLSLVDNDALDTPVGITSLLGTRYYHRVTTAR